jgi:hypothetical protein
VAGEYFLLFAEMPFHVIQLSPAAVHFVFEYIAVDVGV